MLTNTLYWIRLWPWVKNWNKEREHVINGSKKYHSIVIFKSLLRQAKILKRLGDVKWFLAPTLWWCMYGTLWQHSIFIWCEVFIYKKEGRYHAQNIHSTATRHTCFGDKNFSSLIALCLNFWDFTYRKIVSRKEKSSMRLLWVKSSYLKNYSQCKRSERYSVQLLLFHDVFIILVGDLKKIGSLEFYFLLSDTL